MILYIEIGGYDMVRHVHSPVTTRLIGPLCLYSPLMSVLQPYVVWSDLDTFFKMNTTWHPNCWEMFPVQFALELTEWSSIGFKRSPFPLFTIVMYLGRTSWEPYVFPQKISSKSLQSVESPNVNSHWNLAAEPSGTYNGLGGSFVNFVPAFTKNEKDS